MLAKAPTVGADEVVLDLEDAVVPAAKDDAREAVVALLNAGYPQRAAVRVNAPRSPWCHVDLAMLAGTIDAPLSVVVPKVEDAGDLAFVERLLDGAEAAVGRRHRIGVQALIETAAGVANVERISRASSRLETLILGYADLAASLGRSVTSGGLDTWLPVQERLLTAARAAGVQAIDGPYLGTAPDADFYAGAERARALGMDGKWAIHPAQIEALNGLFVPTDAELRDAQEVLRALALSERDGAGAVGLDGRMLDEAVRRSALRVLSRAEDHDRKA
jgi:citrate lyase subunit beta/citryl-CoA lyase